MSADPEMPIDSARRDNRWQLQLGQIEQVLQQKGVEAETALGAASLQSSRFRFRTQLAAGVSRLGEVAAGLKDALLISHAEVVARDGALEVELQPQADVAVPLLSLLEQLPEVPPATTVLGLSNQGQAIVVDVGDRRSPHMLVTGGPAAGKTALLRSTAVALALRNRQSAVQMVAICPTDSDRGRHARQETSWKPLNYLPHMLCDVAFRQTDIRDLLLFLVGELTYREEHRFGQPRIVVLIEQIESVMDRGGAEAASAIHTLLQRGEDAGIHLLASTRQQDLKAFGPQFLSGMPVRIHGRLSTEPGGGASPAGRDPDAHHLLGEGDFVIETAGRTGRFQAAFIDDYDLHLALTRLYAPRKRLLALSRQQRVMLPRQDEEPHGVESFLGYPGALATAD